jgi:hypothetical protein
MLKYIKKNIYIYIKYYKSSYFTLAARTTSGLSTTVPEGLQRKFTATGQVTP